VEQRGQLGVAGETALLDPLEQLQRLQAHELVASLGVAHLALVHPGEARPRAQRCPITCGFFGFKKENDYENECDCLALLTLVIPGDI